MVNRLTLFYTGFLFHAARLEHIFFVAKGPYRTLGGLTAAQKSTDEVHVAKAGFCFPLF